MTDYFLEIEIRSPFMAAFTSIPESTTALHLNGNHLGKRTGAELAQAFSAIPLSVTTLNLSWNVLAKRTGTQLAEAFSAIPSTVTTLDLTGNDLEEKTEIELIQAFSAIPENVSQLNIEVTVLEKMLATIKKEKPTQIQQFELLIALYYRLNHYNKIYNKTDHSNFGCCLILNYLEKFEYHSELIRKILSNIPIIPSDQILPILTALYCNNDMLLFIEVMLRTDLSNSVIRQWAFQILTNRIIKGTKIPEPSWFQNKENLISTLSARTNLYTLFSNEKLRDLILKTLSDNRHKSDEDQNRYDKAAGVVAFTK